MSAETIQGMRGHMRSIVSMRKIARAMFLTSSAKLRSAQESMEASGNFKEQAVEILRLLHPFAEPQQGKTCRIIISGDRGMSGGYNDAVLKNLDTDEDAIFLPIGIKGYEKIRTAGGKIITDEIISSEKASFLKLKMPAEIICEMIKEKQVGKVDIIYTAWGRGVCAERIIPPINGCINPDTIIFEPRAGAILDDVLGNLLAGLIFACVCEAKACEHLSRRIAMDNAQKNADKMLEDVKIKMNRRRRAAITQEIIEAVSGYAAEDGEK